MAIRDPEVRRELETAIAEAVARFGMGGDVFIEDDVVRLVGAGAEVAVELGAVGDQWVTLAPELRQRRATEIARRLVEARRGRVEAGHVAARRGVPALVAPLIVLGLVAVGVYFAWRFLAPGAPGLSFGGTPTASAPSADEYERDRAERAERVCAATRSRILRGATVGPTDVEGWVVELVLSRPDGDPTRDPALGEYLSAGLDAGQFQVSWPNVPELASQSGLGTEVSVSDEGLSGARAIRLTFQGKYVNPYFDGGRRADYVKLANALAERLGATHGALYARCALDSSHHLGAWFLGPSPAGATAALVYWIGAFADPPHVRKAVLFPDGGAELGRSGAFERLNVAASAIDRPKLRTLSGQHGGMITGEGEGRTVLTFPFADSNRAARASFVLAKAAGVGVER